MMAVRNRKSMEEAAWAEALIMPEFGYTDISYRVKIDMKMAAALVRAWAREGRLKELPAGHAGRKLWRVSDAALLQKRTAIARTPEMNMWTAMRALQSFMPSALAAHATVDDVTVEVETARAYCRALLATGYLRATRKAVPGKMEAVYYLIRNSGPQAPLLKRVGAVVDQNTGEVLLVQGGIA